MNLLITGAWQGAKENIAAIEAMGHSVAFLQFEKEPLPCEYSWVEGIIGNGLFLHHPIKKFKNLKYIQLTSAGFDRVPVDYVKEHGIEIHNARGVYSVPMAEFAIGGVLQLYKQAAFFRENQKQHRWEKHRGLLELDGKTVGILGCGSVGSECAKRFAAFGCRVVGIATTARAQEHFDAVYAMDKLDEVLAQVDVLVLTLPLTEQTRYLIGSAQLEKMKNTAVLGNVARGAVVDTDALIHALKEQKLGGAVLDVFEEEPLNEASPLWELENVVLTPHNSFVSDRNQKRLANVIAGNLEGYKGVQQ